MAQRDFHARELARRTGLVALEGQARLLLNDLREYRAWLTYFERRPVSSVEGASRWQAEVLEPYLDRLQAVIGPGRDPLQAYCDLLEHKWLRSERARQDLGLEAAFASYVAAGAPAPEGSDSVRRSTSSPWRRSRCPRTTSRRTPERAAYQRSSWTSSARGRRPPAQFGALSTAGSAG